MEVSCPSAPNAPVEQGSIMSRFFTSCREPTNVRLWHRLGEISEYLLDSWLRNLPDPVHDSIYWPVAGQYYRWRFANSSWSYDVPVDPFKLLPVDPNEIRRYTGRVYPPWRNRRRLFGSVRYGQWDKRSLQEAPRDGGPPLELFVADRLSETLLYRALERRFDEGCAWEETEFVSRAIDLVESGEFPVWHFCSSRSDVLDRCETLDEMYESISGSGVSSQRRRARERRADSRAFLDTAENEILVDIGRDGKLLLVSGKHRLFLARLAGVSTVPVCVLVRHTGWMETRESLHRRAQKVEQKHPDLR